VQDWIAETKRDALAAVDAGPWGVKYKAAGGLIKDREVLLPSTTFRLSTGNVTTNVIESSFATVGHRTVRPGGNVTASVNPVALFR
jgi:hypothetical protein